MAALWSGFENLGVDKKPIEVPMPQYGPDELLAPRRVRALGFLDIKVIQPDSPPSHLSRYEGADPIVLGHEVSLTVVAVGDNSRTEYKGR